MELTEQLIKSRFFSFREPGLLEEIMKVGVYDRVAPEIVLMDVGRYIKTVPLIISGSVRIMREDSDGRELFLYYLMPGETCAVSLTCCMANLQSSIRAVAEEESQIIRVPVEYVDIWASKYASWKNFVMNTYRSRYEELLLTIDSIAFMKMDERLWKYLNDKAELTGAKELAITHQEIADALHSTREVISRLLKQLERNGEIKLGRNRVLILN